MQAVSDETRKIINDMSAKYSNRYIGRSLGISPKTVKKYVKEE
jgi:DNA-binding NarL/FixJ family response regulator